MVPALLFLGEKPWPTKDPVRALLLARFRFVLVADATLELVEVEYRCELPDASLIDRSVTSTATLLLRFWSCDNCSRPTLSVIKDESAGLCDLIGAGEFRAPVPMDELSEAVRFTVTMDADENELEREE